MDRTLDFESEWPVLDGEAVVSIDVHINAYPSQEVAPYANINGGYGIRMSPDGRLGIPYPDRGGEVAWSEPIPLGAWVTVSRSATGISWEAWTR